MSIHIGSWKCICSCHQVGILQDRGEFIHVSDHDVTILQLKIFYLIHFFQALYLESLLVVPIGWWFCQFFFLSPICSNWSLSHSVIVGQRVSGWTGGWMVEIYWDVKVHYVLKIGKNKFFCNFLVTYQH